MRCAKEQLNVMQKRPLRKAQDEAGGFAGDEVASDEVRALSALDALSRETSSGLRLGRAVPVVVVIAFVLLLAVWNFSAFGRSGGVIRRQQVFEEMAPPDPSDAVAMNDQEEDVEEEWKALEIEAKVETSKFSGQQVEVCTVALNPRQGSIFRTNLMSMLGTGKYTYQIQKHGECKKTAPRVRMVPYVKCCMDLGQVKKTIASSLKTYDVIIVTGDEYCAVDTPSDYRQYWGTGLIGRFDSNSEQQIPKYFPLGPRAEFKRIEPAEVTSASRRKYLINFVGSPTSIPRRKLRDFFNSEEWASNSAAKDSYVHITDGWTQKVDLAKGYISSEDYREILLRSKFTLCPMGHNPEAYRIYEAAEAGSIPVMALKEDGYLKHKCKDSYQPFLDSDAPFVFLDTWQDLPEFLKMVSMNTSFAITKQAELHKWYKNFMTSFAKEFEALLEQRFQARTQKP